MSTHTLERVCGAGEGVRGAEGQWRAVGGERRGPEVRPVINKCFDAMSIV